MSGHSKWASIKHKKAAADAKRGKIFTKIIREITVAAKIGGGDPTNNPRLRTAIESAKAANMPADNIDRAVKKGTGELEGVNYEDVFYEGYGPGGVAIMVDCLTDNRNRTGPEVRTVFSKNGGNLGEAGCVSYLFSRKGMIIIEAGQLTEDEAIETLLDFNIEDIKAEDGNIIVTTPPESHPDVSDILREKKYALLMNEITFIPQTTTELDEKRAGQCMRLIDYLEELDDVQNVYSNYDIPEEIMMKLSEEQ